jgi:hypothetical protein
MKRLALKFIFGICFLSWPFLISLSYVYLFPKTAVEIVDHYFLPSHSIEYKDLANSGNILNPRFQFSDLYVAENQEALVKASRLTIGINLSPSIFFKKVIVSNLLISDGILNYKISKPDKVSNTKLILSNNVEFLFTNFQLANDDSSITINGSINGSKSESLSAQLSFMHENNLSTIAVNARNNIYNFAANLHSFKWFQLIPGMPSSAIKNLNLELNAIGSLSSNKSNIQGSIRSEDLDLGLLVIKGNHGSFEYQSDNKTAILKLSQFLHPFLDEDFPFKINLIQQSITAPKIFISNNILEFNNSQLRNLAIDNLFFSFKNDDFKSSGLITDLDLKNIYFKEILNLTGKFSGTREGIRFQINSFNTLIKNQDRLLLPAKIVGHGSLSKHGLALQTNIKSSSSSIDLNMDIKPSAQNPISIFLKGQDLSKELIQISLPGYLKGVNNFIDTSIELDKKNTLYLNFLSPGKNTKSKLKAKFLVKKSQAKINTNLAINFDTALIEVEKNNLYIYSPSANVSNLPSNSVFGALNFADQELKFFSLHSLNSNIFSDSSMKLVETLKSFNGQALHKGQIKLSSKKFNNAISIKTEKFNLPILKNSLIKLDSGNIFIVDLDSLFGSIPANFLKKDIFILLAGNDLINKYSLNFFSKIQLEPEYYFPKSNYISFEGREFFDLNLSIDHKSEPELNIYSSLEQISFSSPLEFFKKKNSVAMPTTIKIQNFSNPLLKIKNQMVDLEIREMQNPQGYISLGGTLPARFDYFKKTPGVNLYIETPLLSLDELNALYFDSNGSNKASINNLAFNIKNAEIFKNSINNISGLFSFKNSEINGEVTSKKLNAKFIRDKTGFMRIALSNSTLRELNLSFDGESKINTNINTRLIVKDSLLGDVKVKSLDVYLLKNSDVLTLNNIKLQSNLMTIKPIEGTNNAYFSINTSKPLYKIKGNFLIKDSMKIPYIKDIADFSYFNGSLNLQWKDLSKLSNIEGDTSFILKDLTVQSNLSNSLAFNLLGVLNLKNIIGKVANLDLSIDEFTSTKLSRVEANMLFNKSKLRLASPLFIETNTAKMKWVGQINKDYKNSLNELDLNLDLRIRVGENLPWYAAVLGGLPAVAGSAVINKVFEEDINDLSNYQYEILGTISKPELRRIK